jgi:hypothetical protein
MIKQPCRLEIMNNDNVINVPFDECKFVSRVVEVQEIQDPDVINIWMLENQTTASKVSVTYIICHHEGKKYVSEALYHSLDFIKLSFIRAKSIQIHIDTNANTYYFDLRFLNIK